MLFVFLEMDEEEGTERRLQIAMLCQKLEKIKRYYNDGDLVFQNNFFISMHMNNEVFVSS